MTEVGSSCREDKSRWSKDSKRLLSGSVSAHLCATPWGIFGGATLEGMGGSTRRDEVVTVSGWRRGGAEVEVNFALGCAFAVALAVMLGLVVYLWLL